MTCCQGIESDLTSSGFVLWKCGIPAMPWLADRVKIALRQGQETLTGSCFTQLGGRVASRRLLAAVPRLDRSARMAVMNNRIAISGPVLGPEAGDWHGRRAICRMSVLMPAQGQKVPISTQAGHC